jgi:hypothetical protein
MVYGPSRGSDARVSIEFEDSKELQESRYQSVVIEIGKTLVKIFRRLLHALIADLVPPGVQRRRVVYVL